MKNKGILGLAAIVILLWLGDILDSDLLETGAIVLILGALGLWLISRYAKSSNKKFYTILLGILLANTLLSEFFDSFEDLTAYIILFWVGYAVMSFFGNGRAKQTKQTLKKPIITDLQAEVKALDQDIQELNSYRDQKDIDNYKQLAKTILPRLKAVKTALHDHEKQLDPATYDRLIDRIRLEKKLITRQLKAYGLTDEEEDSNILSDVKRLAPELLETVVAVQSDSETIKALIANLQSGNQAELLELHETNSRRFDTILKGYLKIKEAPKHYYDAEQRLATAQETMTKFEANLKEQLKQLNENDMHEFEVNLRLLNNYS